LPYSSKFKARMVQRLAGPEGISATALSREIGVPQSTLSRWLVSASTVSSMGGGNSNKGREPKSTRRWTYEEKLRAVVDAATLSEAELGAFLRREGLHEAQLAEWRRLVEAALRSPTKAKRSGPSPEAKKIRALEKELRRKEQALAEVAALLTLKKKADAIWGDADDNTPSKSDGGPSR